LQIFFPQWFRQVTNIFMLERFWHGSCNTYNRTWRKPPVYGRHRDWKTGHYSIVCSLRQKLT
jgi:hypothetical protein